MNWKLILLLSTFGLLIGLCSLFGLGTFTVLLWPIVMVASVLLISARAAGKFALHGFLVGLMIQVWIGAIHAYYLFDLTRAGIAEITPGNIAPQIINVTETAAAALVTGTIIALIVWLATKAPASAVNQAG